MKKILTGIIIACNAMTSFATDYRVEGELDVPDGTKIFMTDYFKNNAEINSGVIENGKFIITGNYDRNAYVRLESEDKKCYANGILDSLLIVDFGTHQPLNSSELNRRYNDFNNKIDSIGNELMRFSRELKSHGFDGEELGDMFKKLYDKKIVEIVAIIKNTLEENDNGVGENALMETGSYISLTPEEWDSIYAKAGEQVKNLPLSIKQHKNNELKKKTAEGQMFTDIEGKSLDGKDVKLSDYVGKGKYVLVDFWASWCGPCIEEAKETLLPLYERIADREKFEILGVATWDKVEDTKEYLKKNPYPWQQIVDVGMTPFDTYGFNYVPMVILFGPDGTILKKDIRGDRIFISAQEYDLLKKD